MPLNEKRVKIIRQHRGRYTFASRFIEPGDVVLDAACGAGQGRAILGADRWIGVEAKDPPWDAIRADLNTWQAPFEFDVFVGLETIEHLRDYTRYVEMAKRARKATIISTPIIPTVGRNRHHVHDFTKDAILDLFTPDLTLHTYEVQEATYGLFEFRP